MAQVITIAQQKGGAGKTTLAAHLAVAFAQKGLRVAAVDIDPQGSLSRWHSLREARFGMGYTGMYFSALSGWRVGSEVARLKNDFDVIVIDSPPHTETDARTAIRHADLVLIPVQPSPADVWATQATVDLAASDKIPARTVLNRVTQSRLAQKFAGEIAGLMEQTLGNRVAYAACLMEGRTATETQPSSPAAMEIRGLTDEIWRLLNPVAEEAKKSA